MGGSDTVIPQSSALPKYTVSEGKVLQGLNRKQQEVAVHGEGPVLVLAVSGSGKTRAIAHRAAYLISAHGVSPSSLLCLTFTNKAAGEMRERIAKLLDGHLSGLTVTTFHSLGARLLRMRAYLIERSSRFVIYDQEDTSRLAKEIGKEFEADALGEQLRTDIDRMKNYGTLAKYDPENRYFKLLRRVYRRYEERLARYDALDFTDLLLKTVRLLEQHPEELRWVRSYYRYTLVDEYQDTCPLQERLLGLISAPSNNLCVVGDDDQGIYSFRGADMKGIFTFKTRYPAMREIRMEENYRSTGAIIEVARRIINGNRRRQPKRIWTARQRGEPVIVTGFPTEEGEAAWVCKTIQHLHSAGMPFGEIALLCRVSFCFRSIERELTKALILYVLVEGLAFWERREIKDIMAYMRFIHNPADYLSFKRIANVPPRGIGKKTLQWIDQELKISTDSLLTILDNVGSTTPKLEQTGKLDRPCRRVGTTERVQVRFCLGHPEPRRLRERREVFLIPKEDRAAEWIPSTGLSVQSGALDNYNLTFAALDAAHEERA